jgi:AraC-like DNA-binding protein
MTKDLVFFLSTLGWFNGIIIAFYFLFFTPTKTLTNRLFGFLLLVLSLRVGKSAIWWFNPDLPVIVIQIGLGACFLIGPLLYYYLKVSLHKWEVLPKRAAYTLGVHLTVVVFTLVFYTDKSEVDLWKKYFIPIIYMHWITFTFISGTLLKPVFGKLIRRDKLPSDQKWLISIFLSFFFVAITYALAFGGVKSVVYITGPILFSLIIYLNVLLFIYRKNIGKLTQPEVKYHNTKIEDAVAAETMAKLQTLLNETAVYVNPDLKITDVAHQVGVSVHHISQVLNDNYQTNFSNFINQYRIEKAKKLIEEKFESLTLEAIGNEAGFKSKSSFFTYFKKTTGMTPNEYRESRKISSEL